MNILIFVVGFFLFLHLLAFICCYDYYRIGTRLNKKQKQDNKVRKKKSIKRRTKKNESSFKVLTIALLILPLIFCMTITYAVIQENSVLKEQLGETNKANIDLYRVLENCECLCNF